jgi:hypothetical protein
MIDWLTKQISKYESLDNSNSNNIKKLSVPKKRNKKT